MVLAKRSVFSFAPHNRGSLAQPVVRHEVVRLLLVCHPLRCGRLFGGCPFYILVACKLRSRRALDGGAFYYSWVLRSLVEEKREREKREEREGFLCFSSCWLVAVGLRLAAALCFGRGVCPSSVACPCCFSLAWLLVGLRPWLAVVPSVALWGFCVPRLLGCWLPGCLSPFLAVCFFPFVYVFIIP
jgi:hypothetical protein